MSKATFPETTGIESLKPLDGGSFSASDVRNALSALFQGDMGALRPRAQTVPDMTIYVNPITLNSFFQQVWGTGNSPLSFGGGNTSVFTAPSANARIDIVYLNSSGVVAMVTGAEAVSPSANWASLPKDGIPICLVYHRASETKIVNFEDKDANPNDGYIYMDVRPFLNLGGGASLADMQAAQDNIALLAFRLAVQGSLTVQKMEDGIVDEYEDETGIDAAASQNENYDSAADCYSPTDAQDLCIGGSPVSGGDENLTGDIIPDSNDKLALNMNGSGASFVDSCSNPKTVSAAGSATQLPAKLTRMAGFFNGTTDYVLVPQNTDFDFGTSDDWTWEAWLYQDLGSLTERYVYTVPTGSGNPFTIDWHSYGGGRIDVFWGPSASYSFYATLNVRTWTHIALCRASGTIRCFVNGVQAGSNQSNATAFASNGPVRVGSYSSSYWSGWIKELRWSKSARYTANFTPASTPFVSDANTKLLLHFDSGALTPIGPAAYFDGAGDYLSIADHPDWDFGTGDFTIECFAMFEANQFSGLIDVGDGNGGAGVTMFYHQSDSNFENRINGTSFARGYTWTPAPYKWYHLAFVRSAGYATMYVDGRPLGAAQASSHNVVVSAACVIGRWNANTSYMHKGFIREVRISNSARYTAAFTPSQTPFTPDTNTKLLLHLDENNGATAFVDSATTPKTVTSNGDAKIKYIEDYRSCIFKDDGNTGHKPYAQGSAKVDFFAPFGTGVGLLPLSSASTKISVGDSDDWDWGTGNWTLEFFARMSYDPSGQAPMLVINDSYTTGFALAIYGQYISYVKSTNYFQHGYVPCGGSGNIKTENIWHHVACVRDGNNYRFFINGQQAGSVGDVTGLNITGLTGGLWLQGDGYKSTLIDNFRVSKGIARYTATFNPTPNVGTNPKEGAFDNSASTWWGSVQTGANVSGAAYVGYNFGSPVTPKAFTIKQHANYIGSVKVQRSSDGSSWVDVQTVTISENNTKNAYSFSNSTAAQYWRLLANDNPSSGSWQVEEIEFMVGAKNDMTLISNGFTAEATPAEIRIVLFEEDVDSLELNTDLKAWVSRDGGTTWTQITLVDEGDYESNKRILAGSISVSGQPSGVAVKYKVTTHNNRNMKIHGASLGWKA